MTRHIPAVPTVPRTRTVRSALKSKKVALDPSAIAQHSAPSEVQVLARELHDRVIQALWCLDLDLTDLRAKVETGCPATVAQLETARAGIATVYEELRLALSELRYDSPVGQPFDDAVRTFLTDFSSKTGIEVTYSPGFPGSLFSKTTQLQLLAILRQATANIRQHARATRVTVATEHGGTDWGFVVVDDGIGFDDRQVRANLSPGHAGLSIMADRARSIRASIDVHSNKPSGTILKVTGTFELKSPVLETSRSQQARGGAHEHQTADR
jgi:two-component system, NarL family, nitrate/nitrite sensor histidine kinase NarX